MSAHFGKDFLTRINRDSKCLRRRLSARNIIEAPGLKFVSHAVNHPVGVYTHALKLLTASSRATIEEWTLVTDKQKDTWVKKGLEGTANPYTVLINHHLSAVQDILSTREDHRQKQLFFLGHAMYRRMRYVHEIVDDGAPEDNPTNPQQNRDYITAALREGMFKRAWRKEVEKEDRGYISEIVQWTSDRFKEVPIKNYVPGVSGPGKHTYLGNHRSGAAPTMIDEVHIAAQWQRFGMDHGGWFFEKTLRTVRQSTGTRTIHLYTRVDDDGNLQDVSFGQCPAIRRLLTNFVAHHSQSHRILQY